MSSSQLFYSGFELTILLMQFRNLYIVPTITDQAEKCLIEVCCTRQSGPGTMGEWVSVEIVDDSTYGGTNEGQSG